MCETKRKIQKKKKNTYGGRTRGEHVGVNGERERRNKAVVVGENK
jgi:hypothetical protein